MDEKLNSSKLSKTGDIITNSLQCYFSGIDATKADNNVSTTVYPTTSRICDEKHNIMTCIEAVVQSNGNIGGNWYVRNFDTNGEMVAHKGITMTMNKSGNLTYSLSDSANFRTAIGLSTMFTTKQFTSSITVAANTTGHL